MAEPSRRCWPAIDLDVRPSATLPADLEDRLALAFDAGAAVAVESDGATHWRVYFETDEARAAVAGAWRDAFAAWFDLVSVDVEDEGWAVKVQRDLGPVTAGRFTVAPPWEVPEVGPGEVLIVIEPSVGFGTGHHQSTRLCLRALERLPLEGQWVVDVGTGSGVLAIAAAKLGAQSVLAIDNDEDAVGAARANTARNAVGDSVSCAVADVATAHLRPSDVVIANLTVHLLRRFARPLAAAVREGGLLVTSGFTVDQVPLVLDAFPDFRVQAQDEEDDWASVTLQR